MRWRSGVVPPRQFGFRLPVLPDMPLRSPRSHGLGRDAFSLRSARVSAECRRPSHPPETRFTRRLHAAVAYRRSRPREPMGENSTPHPHGQVTAGVRPRGHDPRSAQPRDSADCSRLVPPAGLALPPLPMAGGARSIGRPLALRNRPRFGVGCVEQTGLDLGGERPAVLVRGVHEFGVALVGQSDIHRRHPPMVPVVPVGRLVLRLHHVAHPEFLHLLQCAT